MAGVRSEDELGVKWDRCLADTGIKLLGGDYDDYCDGDPGDELGEDLGDDDLGDSDCDLGHPGNSVDYLSDGNVDQDILTGMHISLFLFIQASLLVLYFR